MKKQDIITLIELLKKHYPDATCSLDFTTPFELVVAVMLSAQCTDERVNKTTPELFARCKTIQDFADIDIHELETIIHPCGFYKNKAKNIKLCAKQVLENLKYEIASELGIQLGADTSSRLNGTVGGEMTRRLVNLGKQYYANVNNRMK